MTDAPEITVRLRAHDAALVWAADPDPAARKDCPDRDSAPRRVTGRGRVGACGSRNVSVLPDTEIDRAGWSPDLPVVRSQILPVHEVLRDKLVRADTGIAQYIHLRRKLLREEHARRALLPAHVRWASGWAADPQDQAASA